jgi:hypothetical protein
MLHPLFSTLVYRPDLVIDHAAAYASLLQAEAQEAGSHWLARMLAWAGVAAGALLFMVFAGLALMLGLMMDRFHWVLVLVPGLCLLLTLLAYARASRPLPGDAFADLKAQFDEDVRALRAVR